MKLTIIYIVFLMGCYISHGNFQGKTKEIECLRKGIQEKQKCSILILKLYLSIVEENIIKLRKTLAFDAPKGIYFTLSLFNRGKYTNNLLTKEAKLKIDLEKKKHKPHYGIFPFLIKNFGIREKRQSKIPLKPQVKGLTVSTPNTDAYSTGNNKRKGENILSKAMNNINDILGRSKNNGNEIEENYEDMPDPIKPELFTLRNHSEREKIKFVNNGSPSLPFISTNEENLNRHKLKLKHLFTQPPVSLNQSDKKIVLENVQNDSTRGILSDTVSEKNTFVTLTTGINLFKDNSQELLINEVSTSFNGLFSSEYTKNVKGSNSSFKESHEETNQAVKYTSNICKSSQKSKNDDLKGNDLKPVKTLLMELLQDEVKKDKHLKELQNLINQLFRYSKLNNDFWNSTPDFQKNEFESMMYSSYEYDSELEEIDLQKIMDYLKKYVEQFFNLKYNTEVLESPLKSSFDILLQDILNFQ